MSLQLKTVDRLFEKLAVTYGADWDRSFGNTPIYDVKASWAHELSGFADKLQMIAWALENLPERCPNVIQFRNIARLAPAPEVPRLPKPKADPARVAAELAKLSPTLEAIKAPKRNVDHKEWAKRLIARHNEGEVLNPTVFRFAKEALSNA